MTVPSIPTLSEEPDGPGPHHEHAIWGRIWVEEYVGVNVTERYTLFRYHETKNKVYGGYGNEGDCWTDGSWWTVTNCRYRWAPNGPDIVWKWGYGHYKSGPVEYTLNLELWDFARSGGYDIDCYVSDGEVPAYWEMKCKGNRQSP